MIIETAEEHAVMLELLDELMTKAPGSLAIAVVAKVIQQYELVHFPIPEPTPDIRALGAACEHEPEEKMSATICKKCRVVLREK